MNELININYENTDRPTVMGRELHEALKIESNYTTWFKRMCEYGFDEGKDYATCFPNLESDYHKDIKKGIYWIAAAILSITVTF